MPKGTIWLLYAIHEHTEEVFWRETESYEAIVEPINCSDGQRRRFFSCSHEVVARLWENRGRHQLKFSVWKCADGDGKKVAEPVDMNKEFGAPSGRLRSTAKYRNQYKQVLSLAKSDPAKKGPHAARS